jgi:hypothetical protein
MQALIIRERDGRDKRCYWLPFRGRHPATRGLQRYRQNNPHPLRYDDGIARISDANSARRHS